MDCSLLWLLVLCNAFISSICLSGVITLLYLVLFNFEMWNIILEYKGIRKVEYQPIGRESIVLIGLTVSSWFILTLLEDKQDSKLGGVV